MNFINSNGNDISNKNSPYSLILMLVLFAIIFYIFILRPQQKKIKEQKKLLESISKNDEILTTGGLVGRVIKIIDNEYVLISLNNDNNIIIKIDFITTILPKGTIKVINDNQ